VQWEAVEDKRNEDALERGVGLKLADDFLATTIGVQDLAKKSPEGVFFGKESSAAHFPNLLRLEKRTGDEIFKKLADW